MGFKRRFALALAVVIAFSTVTAVTIAAKPHKASATDFTFSTLVDSYVDSARPTTNFGNSAALQVIQSTSPVSVRHAYMMFQVTGTTDPVTSASLNLWSNTTNSTGVTAYVTGGGWAELTINWNNAPALGAQLGSSGPTSQGHAVSIDVTSAVSGNGYVFLALATTDSTLQTFSSRQGAHTPTLTVSTTPPTTTTVAPTTTTVAPTTTTTTIAPTTTTIAPTTTTTAPPAWHGVTVCGQSLCIDGNTFKPYGASVYASTAGLGYKYPAATIALAQAAHLNTIRLTDFMDKNGAPADPTSAASWLAKWEADPAWPYIDAFTKAASDAGMHVSFTLSDPAHDLNNNCINPWNDTNLANMVEQAYSPFVAWFANRTNTVSGFQYKNDPAVAWTSIVGEPPNTTVTQTFTGTCTPATYTVSTADLTAFYTQTIAAWHNAAGRVLVDGGGLGNLNQSNNGIPFDAIWQASDFCAIKTYGGMFGHSPTDATYCRGTLNKPIVDEEWGYKQGGNVDSNCQSTEDAGRARCFKLQLENALAVGFAGNEMWNLGEKVDPTTYDFGDQPATALTWQMIQAYSPTPPAAVQPNLPIRGAFYYPWFPESWNQQGFNPFTNYTPSLGFYDSSASSVIDQHVAALEYAGQNAAILSWWGQGSATDGRVGTFLSRLKGTSLFATLYYEPEGTSDPSQTQVTSDLNYIASHYGSDPHFLHVGTKPVIFVYNANDTTCAIADKWAAANAAANAQFYVVLKVIAGYAACSSQPDNWHQYAPAVATDAQGTHSYVISPGFWKKGCQQVNNGTCTQGGTSPYLARDTYRWGQNVQSLKSATADLKLLTTFNEWGEGSSIESANEWTSSSGYGAYLDELHSQLVDNNPPPTTTTTTSASTTTTAPTTTTTVAPTTTTTTVAPPSQITVTANADSYVDASNPTSNFGTATTIRADGAVGASNVCCIESYLSFPVSGVGSATVTGAHLILHANSANSAGVDIEYGGDNAWTETGVNWNNRPSDTQPVIASSGATVAGTDYSMNVLGLGGAIGDGTYTFVMLPHASNVTNQPWSSREGAFAPKLVLDLSGGGTTTTTTVAPTTTTTVAPTTTTTVPSGSSPCNSGGAPPAHYAHVVIFAMENRTWSQAGGVGFPTSSTYLHNLATQCTYYPTSDEAAVNPENSATQYVSQMTGFQADISPDTVIMDCPHSPSCSTTRDNLFRQLRQAGKTAVDYVEGATSACSASGNADKHIPPFFFYGTATDGVTDQSQCSNWIKPYSQFNVNALPDFAFITPNLCNDGHDCANSVVDAWSSTNVQAVLNSAAYQSGNTLVQIWWDEDRPKPNLTIAPTALAGSNAFHQTWSTDLKAWQDELGVPCLGTACSAADERVASNT